ncbi:hypothetical protein [Pseudopedobacter saltans]|nr:hypothetical protein [Pseudopedobacter saltans]
MKNRTIALTGKFYHKKVWFAGMVLMVEVKETREVDETDGLWGFGTWFYTDTYFRKATEEDLLLLNISPCEP